MDAEEKEKLHRHILEQIELLKRDITAFKASSQPVSPDTAIGRLTRMEAMNSQSINKASLRKARSSLAGMERALNLIDDEDFGICAECGEAIPFKRLMIVPETRLCVACASRRP